MPLDIRELIERRQGENLGLHEQHINPQFSRVLRTIGFDRTYVRAEGPYLYDAEGRQVLDLLAGYGVFNVGRNHPGVRKVLSEFLATDHPSLVQMEAPLLSGLLAEELKKLVPADLDTVFFTNSGSEGVETAIKYVHCATGRPRIIYFEGAFHGLSNGSLSLNGEGWFRKGFDPLLPSCHAVPFGDVEALRQELEVGDVAACVLEPVQGKGVHIADDEYLKQVRELATRHGALLVFDEVQTGFGRTGKMFALEHSGVVPDVLVLSKALSGGFVPVGAVLTRRSVYDKVFSSMERCVVHSSTFGQGALAMAAGLATLNVLKEERLVENAARLGERLLDGLRDLQSRYELIRDVRGRGLMIGVEFGRPRSFKLKLGWDLAHKVSDGLFGQAIVMPLLHDHGMLTQVSGHGMDVIKLIPPLCISEADVDRFLEAFDDVLRRSHRFPGPIWEVTTRLARHALRR
ncbi:MAG: aspartate aminotransferase family protein [Planctomycetota bacterium]|nr:aspartate aminotransferase family protein [Planctomycetota bacterium]